MNCLYTEHHVQIFSVFAQSLTFNIIIIKNYYDYYV